MINKEYLYAVVGASDNPEKYGYKVLQDLLSNGYRAVPINPRHQEILGQACVASIGAMKVLPDVVIFVVPPVIAFELMKEAVALGVKKFWFQPGTESDAAKQFASEHKLEAVFEACIMIQRQNIS